MESELFLCDAPVERQALFPLNSLLVGARMVVATTLPHGYLFSFSPCMRNKYFCFECKFYAWK
ncbi:hypothetical protein Fmac_028188 [Flemingia macrophylla]|uniref:Uncharacterized protein n=1 Tax=Flemingia macrophylla TaxID=520843 RepID=A0ABD1L6S9_9FABA